jgi:hypothetical protein
MEGKGWEEEELRNVSALNSVELETELKFGKEHPTPSGLDVAWTFAFETTCLLSTFQRSTFNIQQLSSVESWKEPRTVELSTRGFDQVSTNDSWYTARRNQCGSCPHLRSI